MIVRGFSATLHVKYINILSPEPPHNVLPVLFPTPVSARLSFCIKNIVLQTIILFIKITINKQILVHVKLNIYLFIYIV